VTVLPTSPPSAQGVDARGILALVDALEASDYDPHSIVLARHGHVVARGWWAPYSPNRVQLVYSLSKSFTATAVGLLVDEGRLSLDDPVLDLLPAGDLPQGVDIPDAYRGLTLGHCLTMATGHDVEAWTEPLTQAAYSPSSDGSDPVLAAILAHPPEHAPGTAWAYNQVATYLAAAAVRGVTGRSLLSFLRDKAFPLLDPSAVEQVRWQRTATGRELGFSGLQVGTDAILALAQCYLDRGEVSGRRLLSEDWVAAATAPTGLPNREAAPNPDWTQGYGCSFWHARHGYRGDGAFGQFAIILPEQDVALAITAETTDMQGVLELVWEHLLPAVDRDGDETADAALRERLEVLRVPTPSSTASGSDQGAWVRSPDSTLPESYAAVRLEPQGSGAAGAGTAYRLTLDVRGTQVPVVVGDGEWLESSLEVDGRELPVAGSGGWDTQGCFTADLRLVETPHTVRVRTREDGTVDLTWREVPQLGDDLVLLDPVLLATRGPATPRQV
jgi:CubicO group peptidase (beta-lactamase class C family)